MKIVTRLAPFALLFTGACSDVDTPEGCHYHGDDLHCPDEANHPVLTGVILTFTPTGGGDPLVFEWADPEGDGSPEVDEILLPDAADGEGHEAQEYTLDVEVWNLLQDPAEDVTPDVLAQADGHQFFFTGSAVQGPATGDNANAIISQDYGDSDPTGLPLGLTNTVSTLGLGSGELIVTLRHLPAENGEAVKVAGLAETIASEGFDAIGGNNDAQVSFDISVE